MIETITTRDGTAIVIELCPDCEGRPSSAAPLFQRPNWQRFCGCPFDETHTTALENEECEPGSTHGPTVDGHAPQPR
jgi:hypothetical protein